MGRRLTPESVQFKEYEDTEMKRHEFVDYRTQIVLFMEEILSLLNRTKRVVFGVVSETEYEMSSRLLHPSSGAWTTCLIE